jgi:hypothetical protein
VVLAVTPVLAAAPVSAVALVWLVTQAPVAAPISVAAHVWPVTPVSTVALGLAVRALARVVLRVAQASALGLAADSAVASLARQEAESAVAPAVPLALV